MRHRKANVKLGRTAAHRRAMLRNMTTSLIECGSIVTTVEKGKALKPLIDKLMNLAKRGDITSYRRGIAMVSRRKAVKLFFAQVQEKGLGRDRDSGYVASARLGPREGDAAPMAKLTLITPDYLKPAAAPKSKGAPDRSRRVAASRAALEKTDKD
ncbi:MAG: 50S ribosomal protein L17 [Deltaproteobacteria bacterium]|jgi:large subunit ribosomal protein L17|nr:50S ribosomal protein L17 [Deltaproteobacteria bacterium]